MPFVLDCSVTMAWCFEDGHARGANAVLDALAEDDAWVPNQWPLEVANVLVGAERRRRLSAADSARFVALLGNLPITVDDRTSQEAFAGILALARSHRLSAYDAAYLELALRKGIGLATLDRALRSAASKLGVSPVGG